MGRRGDPSNVLTCRDCRAAYTLAADGPTREGEIHVTPRERAERAPRALGWTPYPRAGLGRVRWPWTCPECSPRPDKDAASHSVGYDGLVRRKPPESVD